MEVSMSTVACRVRIRAACTLMASTSCSCVAVSSGAELSCRSTFLDRNKHPARGRMARSKKKARVWPRRFTNRAREYTLRTLLVWSLDRALTGSALPDGAFPDGASHPGSLRAGRWSLRSPHGPAVGAHIPVVLLQITGEAVVPVAVAYEVEKIAGGRMHRRFQRASPGVGDRSGRQPRIPVGVVRGRGLQVVVVQRSLIGTGQQLGVDHAGIGIERDA